MADKQIRGDNYYRKGYLVLRRKPGQGFHIDENTEIVVTKVSGKEVTVAIRAPGRQVVRNEIMKNEPRAPYDPPKPNTSKS